MQVKFNEVNGFVFKDDYKIFKAGFKCNISYEKKITKTTNTLHFNYNKKTKEVFVSNVDSMDRRNLNCLSENLGNKKFKDTYIDITYDQIEECIMMALDSDTSFLTPMTGRKADNDNIVAHFLHYGKGLTDYVKLNDHNDTHYLMRIASQAASDKWYEERNSK